MEQQQDAMLTQKNRDKLHHKYSESTGLTTHFLGYVFYLTCVNFFPYVYSTWLVKGNKIKTINRIQMSRARVLNCAYTYKISRSMCACVR